MQSLNVNVVGSSGKGRKGVRVAGEVGGMTSTHTTAETTNSDGHACISWTSEKSLTAIFIDGKAHKGTYHSGGTYSFNV